MILATYTEELYDESILSWDAPALPWQMDAIGNKLEFARMPDDKLNELLIRLSSGVSIAEADEILYNLNYYIDTEFRSANDINDRVRRALEDERK